METETKAEQEPQSKQSSNRLPKGVMLRLQVVEKTPYELDYEANGSKQKLYFQVRLQQAASDPLSKAKAFNRCVLALAPREADKFELGKTYAVLFAAE